MLFHSVQGAGGYVAPTPISYVGANSATSSGATSITVNNVSGVANGDYLYLFTTYFRNSGTTSTTITTPSGWTEIYVNQDISTGGYRLACAYRKVASSEGASYTVSNAGGVGGSWSAGIVAFRGASAFDTHTLSSPATSTSATTTAATVAASNSAALFVTHCTRGNNSSITVTFPAGWTEVVDATPVATQNTELGIAYKLSVPSGTLTSATATIANTASNRAAYVITKD